MKRGDIVEVKNYKQHSWLKRIFLLKLNKNNYLCVYTGMEENYLKGLNIEVVCWKYIKKKH